MKWFGIVLLIVALVPRAGANSAPEASDSHGGGDVHGAPVPSVLAPEEASLKLSDQFLTTDAQGAKVLMIRGEPLSLERVEELSPWDLMEVVQVLSGTEIPLRRFGNGAGDPVTEAWRAKVVALWGPHEAVHHEVRDDRYDPRVIPWDPGFIQTQNSWGQWVLHLDRRDIIQSDIPTLSPLEIQQAIELLTGRTYPLEDILRDVESFRAWITVSPRVVADTPQEHHSEH